ncbi:mas-related G-protein coupled receptor member H-like [Pantherophis guttatus]|uniref:Mas-related G-protein coupled receptor member H-like n=1 Tax=Pantherophis guttatus TaxID=94885 RepID=A0ABM3YXV8_PANGU|nr:mas-related G-protein coupled receptor member H-like [Pantherophis guttatus]
MAEFDPTLLFDSEMEYNVYNNRNWTEIVNFLIPIIPNFTEIIIFNVILFAICFLGLLGNGKVIWILGFHMKRNSFSIYVLNLAVADCGVLIMLALVQIFEFFRETSFGMYVIVLLLYFMLYNTSQLLLISISVDRCVSVLFPIWHQCHRPPKLSLIVCVITWVLPFVCFVLEMVIGLSKSLVISEMIFSALFPYPTVIISTLILLVKIFIKQRQQKRKKVLMVTLLALMCFIVLRLPVNIFGIITCCMLISNDLTWGLYDLSLESLLKNEMMGDKILDFANIILPWIQPIIILEMVSDICIAVNSSINPILYFLAGRNKEDRSRVSMKLVLRRVFRNEEDAKENEMQPDETPL